MTIDEAQQHVDNWITTVGIRYFSELTNLGILMEEAGELSRLLVRIYGEQSFKETDLRELTDSNFEPPGDDYMSKGRLNPETEKKLLANEMADVLWVLICLANQTGVNLTEALKMNFEKKNIRDAERHRKNEKLK